MIRQKISSMRVSELTLDSRNPTDSLRLRLVKNGNFIGISQITSQDTWPEKKR